MERAELIKNGVHVAIFIGLVFALLFLLVNFGYLRPCDIPGFSGIYFAIKGEPRVALVYGEDGTGDAKSLAALLASESRVFPTKIPVDLITDSAVIDPYHVVIVEHARTMSTQTLRAFQQYVQKGGRLVWIGDAGTGLGENDNVCEPVKIKYTPSVYYVNESAPVAAGCTQTSDCYPAQGYSVACTHGTCNYTPSGSLPQYEQCGEEIEADLKLPEEYGGQLCGKTFGEIVEKFIQINQTIYAKATSSPNRICKNDPDTYYKIEGASRITSCIKQIVEDRTLSEDEKTSILADPAKIEEQCPVYNYWQRGPSKTQTGAKVDSIDFSALVLGFDFVSDAGVQNLFLQPLDPSHPLIKGYDTTLQYAATSNVTLTSSERFSSLPRTSTLMTLHVTPPPKGTTAEDWPAVLISNPTLQLGKRGLIIYYAFPPDDLTKAGAGYRFINNLFSYCFCQ